MSTNRRGRIPLVMLLVGVLSLGTFAGTSAAQIDVVNPRADEGPPSMDLRWGGHSRQQGWMGSYCWTQSDGAGTCVDSVGDWPKAMWVRSGATLHVRIEHAEKPEEFDVTTFRRVDGYGQPKGRGQAREVTFKPVVRDGETYAWDASFKVGGNRHHYISVFALWSQGDVSWRFHVRTIDRR